MGGIGEAAMQRGMLMRNLAVGAQFLVSADHKANVKNARQTQSNQTERTEQIAA